MKQYFSVDAQDFWALTIIIICSPIFALLQHYQSPALFGSTPAAILASFPLGIMFTSPLVIYFLAKYSRRFARLRAER